MIPSSGRLVDDIPSSAPAGACTVGSEPLSSSLAIFEKTNPGVRSSGVRMIAQFVSAGTGPTARHSYPHPDSDREMSPCSPL
jgi:hypothetical protein